jgi:hypothetical protein
MPAGPSSGTLRTTNQPMAKTRIRAGRRPKPSQRVPAVDEVEPAQ